jgi:transcription initiation factor IIE alpha subunit
MTATVLEFKCPTCGHLLGEEEYKRSNANIDRLIEEKSQGLIEQMPKDVLKERTNLALEQKCIVRMET